MNIAQEPKAFLPMILPTPIMGRNVTKWTQPPPYSMKQDEQKYFYEELCYYLIPLVEGVRGRDKGKGWVRSGIS